MKTLTLTRTAWSVLAAAGLMLQTTWAQENNTPSEANGGHHYLAFLTPEERQELKTDREAVFSANPDLKSEAESLRQQRESLKTDSPEQKKAFFQAHREFEKKMDAALIQQDPNVKPILQKIREHRKEEWEKHRDNQAPAANT